MADHSDDLDKLLDSALDDFQNINFTPPQRSGGGDGEAKKKESGSLPSGVQGLGMGLPDLKSKKKGKQKVLKESHVTEALDKLREQTRETVKGLESMPKPGGDDFGKDEMMEDWVKQFEELAGSQDMESIVETMMQQLLSKEILHEPMKEIGERYPQWLEEHKANLSKEEYERYSSQYELIKELNGVYENDPNNFTRIVDLMQKMQECGQPPNDIVQELAPEFDLSNLGQLSPDMLNSQQNCCIMLLPFLRPLWKSTHFLLDNSATGRNSMECVQCLLTSYDENRKRAKNARWKRKSNFQPARTSEESGVEQPQQVGDDDKKNAI